MSYSSGQYRGIPTRRGEIANSPSPARALGESASHNQTHELGMVEMDISGSIGQPEQCLIKRLVNYLVEVELAFESKQILDD